MPRDPAGLAHDVAEPRSPDEVVREDDDLFGFHPGECRLPSMLQLSDGAVAAIREMVDDGSLRLVAVDGDGEVEFESTVADEPEEGDEIVESDGIRVFLDTRAAQELADQVLDVHAHGDHVHFVFSPQT